jgi:hypothetical protein
VAFGLRAGALALKARAGKRVSHGDLVDLAGFWRVVAPEDEAVGAAIARFMVDLHLDAHAAGGALLDFIEGWRGGDAGRHLRRCEAVLADVPVRVVP